ncbi:MAG TPA: Asp23/Gls24 family envelope stress response protein [Clostridia bacterium]|nr:Asp23/Gls24 family envelope stress response protein [Clostridia bacterium]
MDEKTKNENVGNLVISENVIASIALNAAKDVDGVSGFAARPADVHTILNIGDEALKSVRIWAGENDIKLQIFIKIKNGRKIPTVAADVQRAVKNAVQSMTGKIVTKVNVSISAIDFGEQNKE